MKKKQTAAASLIMLAVLLLLTGLASVDAMAGRTPGVTLPQLDPAIVDDVLQSYPVTIRATIKFVNQSSTPVDIYWINFDGHRVLYRAGLAVNAIWTAGTSLTHPWLVVVSGTGGTTEPDTGRRLAGFLALSANGDTAIITDPK